MALSATTNSAQQSNTQNPQTVGQSTLPGGQSGGVQPGTNQNLLAGQGSIPLGNQQVTTVNLNPGTATSPRAQSKTPAQHHFNHGLILITVLLLLVAAVSAVLISRSAKNTTY
jgi:hypothetical protein